MWSPYQVQRKVGALIDDVDGLPSFPLATTNGGTGKTYDVVPTGVIFAWTTTSAPTGFLLCDASAVSRTTYADLFTTIGTTFGTGDGLTTFNVPDLRGRTIIMLDGSAARISTTSYLGSQADTMGGAGGLETATLTTAMLPNFSLGTAIVQFTDALGANAAPLNTANHSGTSQPESLGTVGSGAGHSNTQPWLALNYIIKY